MAIHMILMPATTAENCQLLVFNRSRMTDSSISTPFIVKRISSTVPANFTYDVDTPVSFDVGDHMNGTYKELFCAGHTLLEDGKVFIAGGHGHPGEEGNDMGIKKIFTLDPLADPVTWTFTERSEMKTQGRWYPTVLSLPNGNQQLIARGTHALNEPTRNSTLWTALVPGGTDFNGTVTPEDPLQNNFYPFLFIDPTNGRPLYTPAIVGDQSCRLYDPVTSEWTPTGAPQYDVPNTPYTYPSGVNVDGFILKSGGGSGLGENDTSVNTTLYVNLLGDRIWKHPTGAGGLPTGMAYERMNHTLVALPDGKVLAMGGNYMGPYDTDLTIRTNRTKPEMFDTLDATNPQWVTLRGITVQADIIGRGYHSTALLLPNADVIIAGGEGFEPDDPNKPERQPQQEAQIFSPPYGGIEDWKLTRPTINTAPTEIFYGTNFNITYSMGAMNRAPARLTLISLGATTHAFNQHQHVTFLPFNPVPSTAEVSWETRHQHLPAGYYMLFLVDDAGVPSVAKIVRVRGPEDAYPASYQVVAGTVTPGITAMNSLYLAENTRFGKITTGVVPTGTYVVFEGTSPYASPSQLFFEVESKADWITAENTNPVRVTLEAWNWATNQYVVVGQEDIPRGNPTSGLHERRLAYQSPGGVPLADFIRTSDRKMRLKAIWRDDFLPSAVFDFSIDLVRWRVRK
jgi:hypothetical protein